MISTIASLNTCGGDGPCGWGGKQRTVRQGCWPLAGGWLLSAQGGEGSGRGRLAAGLGTDARDEIRGRSEGDRTRCAAAHLGDPRDEHDGHREAEEAADDSHVNELPDARARVVPVVLVGVARALARLRHAVDHGRVGEAEVLRVLDGELEHGEDDERGAVVEQALALNLGRVKGPGPTGLGGGARWRRALPLRSFACAATAGLDGPRPGRTPIESSALTPSSLSSATTATCRGHGMWSVVETVALAGGRPEARGRGRAELPSGALGCTRAA